MDIFVSFQSDAEKNQISHVLNTLQNFYTTYVSLDFDKQNDEEEIKQIKESKLFVALVTPSFLNSDKCMMQLKCALKYSKKVYILENEHFKIPLETVEEFKLNSINCAIIKFKSDETNHNDKIINIISYYLK